MLTVCTVVSPPDWAACFVLHCYSLSRWKAGMSEKRYPSLYILASDRGSLESLQDCILTKENCSIYYSTECQIVWIKFNRVEYPSFWQQKAQQKQPNKNPSKTFSSRKTRSSKIIFFYEYLHFRSENHLPEKSLPALVKDLQVSKCSIPEAIILSQIGKTWQFSPA